MQVVLYTDDFEPITVINLPPFAKGYLENHRHIRVPVPVDITDVLYFRRDAPIIGDTLKVVTIKIEKIYRNGKEHFLFFTNDEESALLLKSTFLPGQRSEIRKKEREAFCRGFLRGFTAALSGG